jgi:hypothetical protein
MFKNDKDKKRSKEFPDKMNNYQHCCLYRTGSDDFACCIYLSLLRKYGSFATHSKTK